MKKLLALVLVLAVASLSSAAIMSPMTIVDLGGGMFGIELTNGMSAGQDASGGVFALIGVAPTSGAISATLPASLDLSFIGGDTGDTGLFAPGSGVFGMFASGSTAAWTAAAGVYADGFLATAQVLELYRIDDAATEATLVDTYIIPEPATIAVLSLGGLLLRRKK